MLVRLSRTDSLNWFRKIEQLCFDGVSVRLCFRAKIKKKEGKNNFVVEKYYTEAMMVTLQKIKTIFYWEEKNYGNKAVTLN